MACVAGLLALMYVGRPILVSFTIAVLLSFILYPLCRKIESWGVGRIITTLICLISFIGILAGTLFLFSSEIVDLASQFSDFGQKLEELFNSIVKYSNRNIELVPNIDQHKLMDKGEEWVKESSGFLVKGTVSMTMSAISGLMMVFIYTFLLLIYRSGLVSAATHFSSSKHREDVRNMISDMQRVGQSYLVGMSIMIGILGTANSIVLFIIGIENAILFGFMAAFLSIIPYVGTTLGAAIPVLYSFMTSNSLVTPMIVIAAFAAIQFIESNFLSPKIVGGNLNINALVAIITLILGGYIWGVAGMTLFLPLTAIFKVFCSYYKPLKPVGLLIGERLYK